MMLRKWLTEARRASKLSHRALGKLVGVSHVTVINWENGSRNPCRTAMFALDRIFPDLGVVKRLSEEAEAEQNGAVA